MWASEICQALCLVLIDKEGWLPAIGGKPQSPRRHQNYSKPHQSTCLRYSFILQPPWDLSKLFHLQVHTSLLSHQLPWTACDYRDSWRYLEYLFSNRSTISQFQNFLPQPQPRHIAILKTLEVIKLASWWVVLMYPLAISVNGLETIKGSAQN